MTVINALPVLQDDTGTGILNQGVYTGSYSVADVSGKTPRDLNSERTQRVVVRGIHLP